MWKKSKKPVSGFVRGILLAMMDSREGWWLLAQMVGIPIGQCLGN